MRTDVGGVLEEDAKWRRLVPSVFDAFVELADAPEGSILRFAQRWGPLLVCDCQRPWHHPPEPDFLRPCSGPGVEPYDDDHTTESLDTWRAYSHRARALLLLAADFHRGKAKPSGGHWDELLATGLGVSIIDGELTTRHNFGVAFQRSDVGEVVDEWLQQSGVRMAFTWPVEPGKRPHEQPRPGFGLSLGDGLLPYLGVQLALAVAREDGRFYTCDSCGRPVTPKRKPAPGRRIYCTAPECLRARARDAQRDKRKRDEDKRKRDLERRGSCKEA